jgi:outer membrane autotransporter protein
VVTLASIKNIADVATGSNGDTIGEAIENLCSSEAGCGDLQDIYDSLLGAETADEVDAILEALNPAGLDGGLTGSVLDVGAQVLDLTDQELLARRSGDELTGMAAGASANGASMWDQFYGQAAQQDTRHGIKGYNSGTMGLAIGADSTDLIKNGVLGLALNYGKSNVNSKNANTTGADIQNYGAYLYGTYNLDQRTFVNGQIGYAYNAIHTYRHNAGITPGDTANASFHSDQYAAKVLLGRDYQKDAGLTLTPNVSLAYTNLSTASYAETGTGTLLTVGSENFDIIKLGAGAKAEWHLEDSLGNQLRPALHADYAYDLTGNNVEETATFAGGGPIFKTTGATPARSEVIAGAGLTYKATGNWDLAANYDYTYKANYAAHAGTLRLTAHF